MTSNSHYVVKTDDYTIDQWRNSTWEDYWKKTKQQEKREKEAARKRIARSLKRQARVFSVDQQNPAWTLSDYRNEQARRKRARYAARQRQYRARKRAEEAVTRATQEHDYSIKAFSVCIC